MCIFEGKNDDENKSKDVAVGDMAFAKDGC